jgi:hypothetical protein
VPHPANRMEVENQRLDENAVGGAGAAGSFGKALAAGARPFRYVSELGQGVYDRAFNRGAVNQALDLTGIRGSLEPAGRTALGRLWNNRPAGIPFVPDPAMRRQPMTPSTSEVLANLESTAKYPLAPWQRHVIERAIAADAALGTGYARQGGGLLNNTTDTEPTDPRFRRAPGLLTPVP